MTNQPVFRWWDYPVYAALTVVQLTAAGVTLPGWFSPQGSGAALLLWAAVTALLLFGLVLHAARWASLPMMRRPEPIAVPPGLRVGVATTFVPDVEDIGMLEETVAAIVAMEYQHDTWVLDEGDDRRVRALCARLGAHYFTRRNRAEYQTERGLFRARTKYGNYNAWLHEAGFERYDAIVAFDPDHIPDRRFLTETLGYLLDARVGYVQAPQVYYNQAASFIARGAAEETYAYYSSLQMSAYRAGYPIVTGCHNVHRTTALRAVGGFAAHQADDLLITLYYQAAGWRGVYVPKPLAEGLTPVDWADYLNQQRRWARSTLDIKLRIFPRLAGKLPWLARLTGAVHGLYYLQGLMVAAGLALLAIVLVVPGASGAFGSVGTAQLALLAGALVVSDLYRQRFYLDPRRECGLHWRGVVLRFAKWPVLLLALLDVLRPRGHGYFTTPKTSGARTTRGTALAYAHGPAVTGLTVACSVGLLVTPSAPAFPRLVAVALILFSIGIIASGRRRVPASYDPTLPRNPLP